MTAIHDGLRFTALSFDIRAVLIRATHFGLAAISILALQPLVARDRLAGGPIVYGVLFAGFGTGACIAGLSNRVLRKLLPQEWLMAIASIACAICCVSIPSSMSGSTRFVVSVPRLAGLLSPRLGRPLLSR